jgi:hypothetical protein
VFFSFLFDLPPAPNSRTEPGISHAYGGALSALSIDYNLTPSASEDGEKWIEREVVSAIYTDSKDVLVVDEREVADLRLPS